MLLELGVLQGNQSVELHEEELQLRQVLIEQFGEVLLHSELLQSLESHLLVF